MLSKVQPTSTQAKTKRVGKYRCPTIGNQEGIIHEKSKTYPDDTDDGCTLIFILSFINLQYAMHLESVSLEPRSKSKFTDILDKTRLVKTCLIYG